MVDLLQMANILHHCTNKSLILVDEFGKGTSAAGGVALLTAVLIDILNTPGGCPRACITTHYHDLYNRRNLPDNPNISYKTMKIINRNNEVVYLHNLVDGATNLSLAANVAKLAGVPMPIIDRMEVIMAKKLKDEPIQPVPMHPELSERNDAIVAVCREFFSKRIEVEDLLREVKAIDMQYQTSRTGNE
eukprot:CFRG6130T1